MSEAGEQQEPDRERSWPWDLGVVETYKPWNDEDREVPLDDE